jgi:glycosyltransferase involved in cell wall biosynthesis
MSDKIKIGYLVPQFPGQTHIFFWRELIELENMGVDAQIYSTRLPPPSLISHDWSKAAIERTLYIGAPKFFDLLSSVFTLPYKEIIAETHKSGAAFLKDVLICASAAKRLLRDCRVNNISHVHVHSCARAALIAALANRMGGLSYSLTLHGPMSDYGIGQGFKWRRAKFATIITQKLLAEAKQELELYMPDRVVVQPMGVDLEKMLRHDAYVPATPTGKIRLFSCGRLNIVKGHQDLLQAVRILVDRGLDVVLEIAGEDDDGGQGYRQTLSVQLQALGLENHAKLLGAIDANAVKEKLTKTHVFVLASWHEPLGVAYMEAMACGVPTIGTNAGGVRELIDDGINGRLVEPKSPEALADVIEEIINNPDQAQTLSKAGRDHIVQGYSSAKGAEVIKREIAEV